jgi:hypothetical protein
LTKHLRLYAITECDPRSLTEYLGTPTMAALCYIIIGCIAVSSSGRIGRQVRGIEKLV